MKAYICSILIQSGGYEKEGVVLVTEVPEDAVSDAFAYACVLEAHNDLVDEGNYYSDGDYFCYSPKDVKEVEPEDLPVVSKYLRPFKYNDEAAKTLSMV